MAEQDQAFDKSMSEFSTGLTAVADANPSQDQRPSENKPAPAKAISQPDPKPADPKPAEPKVEPNPAPAKAPAPAKQPAPAKAPEKAADKPAEPKVEEKPAEAAPGKPRPWQKVHDLEAEKKNLLARVADLEAKQGTAQADPAALKAVTETLAAKEKRLAELEDRIRFTDFKSSDEYTTKYKQPYENTVREVMGEAVELLVENPADGTARALTQKEAWNIISQPSLEAAYQEAKKIFPDDADKRQQLITYRKQVQSSWNTLAKAEAEYREKGAEIEKQRTVERTLAEQKAKNASEQRAAKWAEMNEAAFKNEQLKDYFTPAEDDAKGKEILTKGKQVAALAFGKRDGNGNIIGEDGKPLSDEDTLAIDSGIHNKAAAFNYVAYRNRALQARVKEVEAKLAEYEKSEPGVETVPAGGEKPKTAQTTEEAFESFLKTQQG